MYPSNPMGLDPQSREFYQSTMKIFNQHRLPFLVGGAYAFARYTGVERHTKDFDLFVRPTDVERALQIMQRHGFRVELTDKIWIAKIFNNGSYVDLIFGSANDVARVDEQWFEFAIPNEVLDLPALLIPPEELIWSKAFIMERDRFDGADIAHVIKQCSDKLNWIRLEQRFGGYWRVLLVHLIMFGLVYPSERNKVPTVLMQDLLRKLETEVASTADLTQLICEGPLLSQTQYAVDFEQWGYRRAAEADVLDPESDTEAA
jgi:hypothetical protein